jgi:hypothetical protein
MDPMTLSPEDRLEDWQLHGVVLGERHEYQPTAAAQRCVCLFQHARVCGEDDGNVGPAERTDGCNRVTLASWLVVAAAAVHVVEEYLWPDEVGICQLVSPAVTAPRSTSITSANRRPGRSE